MHSYPNYAPAFIFSYYFDFPYTFHFLFYLITCNSSKPLQIPSEMKKNTNLLPKLHSVAKENALCSYYRVLIP